jgi:hypothetical protein
MEFEMQDKSHFVDRLPVHLRGGQVVVLDEEDDIEDENDPIFEKDTKLSAYFKWNAKIENEEDRLLYAEMPKHCVWDRKNREWRARKRTLKPTVGRLYTVSPSQSEQWHLRILLHYVRASSWKDLKTFNNKVYKTYAAAALDSDEFSSSEEGDEAVLEYGDDAESILEEQEEGEIEYEEELEEEEIDDDEGEGSVEEDGDFEDESGESDDNEEIDEEEEEDDFF